MADATIDTSQSQYFIPEIWGGYALPILRSYIQIAPRILRDTDVAAFQTGSTLHIPYPGTLSATAKTAGEDYALGQPSGHTEKQVTLDKHEHVTINVADVVKAQSSYDVMDLYARAQVIALAEQIETDILSELTGVDATYSVGTYGTDLSAATVRTAAKTMTDNKAPRQGRTLVFSTKDTIALQADSTLSNYWAFNQQGIQTGELGGLYGFSPFESQLIPTVAATPVQTKNVAFTREAAMLAMRGLPEPPPNTGAVRSTVRDPESGLVLSVLMGYDIRRGGVQVTFEALYGVKVIEPRKLLLVKS